MKRTRKEETIRLNELNLRELIPFWMDIAPGASLPTGVSVDEALSQALVLRAGIASGGHLNVDLQNQDEAADVLHAVCRTLMTDCEQSPESVLEEAAAHHRLLGNVRWPNDHFDERESLLNSFAYMAWRAARILDLSREVHWFESEYERAFRQSIAYHAMDVHFSTENSPRPVIGEAVSDGSQWFFQALIYLHDHLETDPKRVSNAVRRVYRSLESEAGEVAPDIRHYFLGEAATLLAAALRGVGNASEVERWLDVAEKHFRAGVNPNPGLAKVLYLRLSVYYTLGRVDIVSKVAPQLEAALMDLGMEEARVKCRILWAASLKLAGHLREALNVLEPVKEWRTRIRPALFGWVLLQCGDIHQNLTHYEHALKDFGDAALMLRAGKQYVGLANLNSMMSCIYRSQGRFDEALSILETSRQDHARLGMTWPEGYHRMLIAETYLAMGRPKEAETEIRAALPILEEHGMLADAVIAVNLLREAIRQRKLLPVDIRDFSKPKT